MITSFNTDVALANLFACRKKDTLCISYEGLNDYIKLIQTGNPLFMHTDISHKAVTNCVNKYSKLYKIGYPLTQDTIYIHNPTHYKPNLDYFMQDYSKDDRKYIQYLTTLWIQERLS